MRKQKKYQSPNNNRLVVADNFYTRPSMSMTVRKMTDGEIRTIGTCRLSFTGIPNRPNLEKGIDILKKMDRGSWLFSSRLRITSKSSSNEKEIQFRNQKNLKGTTPTICSIYRRNCT